MGADLQCIRNEVYHCDGMASSLHTQMGTGKTL